MHGAAPLVGISRKRLGLVDGRLGAFEYVPLLDDLARFGETASKVVGPRVRSLLSGAPPPEEARKSDSSE